MQSCPDQADGWFPGTSDIDKEVLPKKFFQTMQKQPPQTRFTFRTLLSKSKKKILHMCKKKIFFLQKLIAFGERIPKRYNTWGLESYFRIWAGGGCGFWWGVWLGAGS